MGLVLEFGALAPPVEVQLERQGIDTENIDGAYFQGMADIITRLAINHLLTERETEKARKRLLRKVCREIRA